MITLLAAVLSGILFYLSQGYDHVWALVWLAPVPLLWLAYGQTRTWQLLGASAIALLAGAGYVLQSPYLHLIPPLVLTLALVADIGLFCVAVWFARFVQRRASPLLTLLAFPACWTAFEFLIELQSPNGTYGSLAYSTMPAPVLIQGASLFGMYVVTFLICLFANTLAMALRLKRITVAVGLGLTISAANLLFGIVRLAHPQPAVLRVAGIVDESAVAASWQAKTASADLAVTQTYAREIRAAARKGARFVVTSEGGMASIPASQSAIVAPLVAAAKDTGVQVIAGFHSETPAADFALAIAPDGSRIQRYDKRHPVPGLEDAFKPGHASGWLGNGRAEEICKDMDFPDTIRFDAARGIRLMGVPAGDMGIDGWQHGIMSVMRGVEGGFSIVRAAHDGLVFASDAQGRLVALKKDAPTGPTMIVADLPLGSGPTLYTRIGNLFPWLCGIFVLVLGAGLPAWCRLRGATH